MFVGITERMAADNVMPVLAKLARPRMRRFGRSLDDLGTGYASMDQLGRIPFTELKIHRGCVTGAATKPVRARSSSRVSSLRAALTRKVVERVESEAGPVLLEARCCDHAHSAALVRPMDEPPCSPRRRAAVLTPPAGGRRRLTS